jgi:hypothetical protein
LSRTGDPMTLSQSEPYVGFLRREGGPLDLHWVFSPGASASHKHPIAGHKEVEQIVSASSEIESRCTGGFSGLAAVTEDSILVAT